MVIRMLAGLLVLVSASAAHGHSTLVRATPAARATLKMSPERVQLWFSERLEPAYSSASVWLDDQRIDRKDSTVSTQDPKLLTVSLPALVPGRYEVRYRVLSVDGHVVEGRLPFTVTGEPGGSGAKGK